MSFCYTLEKGSSRLITLDDIAVQMQGRLPAEKDVTKTELFLLVCHDLAEAYNCHVTFRFDLVYDLVESCSKSTLAAKFTKKR